jgi:hypothetical protein
MRPFVVLFVVCLCAGLYAQAPERSGNTRGKLFDIPGRHAGKTSETPVVEIPSRETPAVETPSVVAYNVFSGTALPPISVGDLPALPRFIMGKGKAAAEGLASFLMSENQNLERSYAETLALLYIAEAETEGVNHDIAFAQMCLETGFLRFGGLVVPEMNNFCGLGSIGPGEEGLWFPSAELGVRAHIQHLKAYADDDPLRGELVDPRFRFVRRGRAPTVDGLAGTWAADKLYAHKLERILDRLEAHKAAKTPGTETHRTPRSILK